MRRLCVLVALGVGCSAPAKNQAPVSDPAPAQSATERKNQAIQDLLDRATASPWLNGVSVAVHRDGQTRFYGSGQVRAGGPKPGPDTVFEIGSITKVFTALLLADAVTRKEVALDQTAQSLLPTGFTISDFEGKQITLEHLAAHSSGLPRMPANIPVRDPKNPYAAYTPKLLYEFLAHVKLATPPGVKSAYSNLGSGLLGHLLAMRAKRSYGDLVRERVLEPLGMKDTAIALSDDMLARFAQGHDGEGSATSPWDIPVIGGAGALRSTARDLMRFVLANLTFDHDGLAAAMRLTHIPRIASGTGGHVALGWHIDKGVLWHNGGTGGFHSFAAFNPKTRAAVVVLGNTSTGLIDKLGSLLLEPPPAGGYPLELPKTVEVSAATLKAYVGRYQVAPGAVAEITLTDGKLYIQLTGQPRFRMFASSNSSFFLRVVPAKARFENDNLIIQQAGRTLTCPRIVSKE